MKLFLGWFKSDPFFAVFSLSLLGLAVGFWVSVIMIVAKGLGL